MSGKVNASLRDGDERWAEIAGMLQSYLASQPGVSDQGPIGSSFGPILRSPLNQKPVVFSGGLIYSLNI